MREIVLILYFTIPNKGPCHLSIGTYGQTLDGVSTTIDSKNIITALTDVSSKHIFDHFLLETSLNDKLIISIDWTTANNSNKTKSELQKESLAIKFV